MLLPHLLQLRKEHLEAAVALQQEIIHLEDQLRLEIDQVWAAREEVMVPIDYLQITAGGTVKLSDKIPKPTFANTAWKISWLGLPSK